MTNKSSFVSSLSSLVGTLMVSQALSCSETNTSLHPLALPRQHAKSCANSPRTKKTKYSYNVSCQVHVWMTKRTSACYHHSTSPPTLSPLPIPDNCISTYYVPRTPPSNSPPDNRVSCVLLLLTPRALQRPHPHPYQLLGFCVLIQFRAPPPPPPTRRLSA